MAGLKDYYKDGLQNFIDFMGHVSINPNAVFILVMGLTGSGKSTFVSRCTGLDVQVGHDMRSCTQSLGIFRFSHEGRDVYLIDTPGFDDTERPDEETLGLLAHFLGVSYANRRYINGIVYLHRISDNRVSGSHQRNFNMLKALCGEDAYHNIVIASTMWKSADLRTMSRRENELLSKDSWLGSMCGPAGATYFRHAEMGSGPAEERQSALRIVSYFFRQETLGPVALLIQHELVDAGQPLEETQAGQAILGEIGKVRHQLQQELDRLNRESKQALEQRDINLSQSVEALREELRRYSAVNDRVHQALTKTLPELHEQQKRRFIERMDAMERYWDEEASKTRRDIAMLQQQLSRSRADVAMSRNRDLDDCSYGTEKLNELENQIRELQSKYQEFSGESNQRVEAHRNVRRVLADGSISGAVSGFVGAVVAGSMCVLM